MRSLPAAPRPLLDALALGPALLDRARAERTPWIAASVVAGPAIVLGAAQRAGRVVDLAACARDDVVVLRRATTGAAAHLGARAVVWTLALPHVAALAPDAGARTALNRNVRGFLKGFTRAGAIAHYFGREWISVRHRPAALLGLEVAADGAVLIEVWSSHDTPPALPAALATDDERAIDRFLGKVPAALAEVLPAGLAPEALARVVLEAVALHAASPLDEGEPLIDLPRERFRPIEDPLDPLPPSHHPAALARVPIGWVEAAAPPGAGPGDAAPVWVGGDVLTGRWILDEIGRGAAPLSLDPTAVALEGATVADLVAVAQRARGG